MKSNHNLIYRKISSIILSLSLLAGSLLISCICPLRAYAVSYEENITVYVDEEATFNIRAASYEYKNNRYISLMDLASALSGTPKEFDYSYGRRDGDPVVYIRTGKAYEPAGGENVPYEDAEVTDNVGQNYKRNRICVCIDDVDSYFYVMCVSNSMGNSDCLMNTGELGIMLNLNMKFEDGALYIDTDADFDFYTAEAFDDDFFDMTDSCLTGDVTTGDIYFSRNADIPVPIASTTKLMTYLVIKDAVRKGEISWEDTITFSKNAEFTGSTEDGVLKVKAGDTAPLEEVVTAMLIASSNECAQALAEHLCQTEEAFVERMNKKAKSLGMSRDCRFYNSNGLPIYQDDVLTGKNQNKMTANDMFILAGKILSDYPEITQITSAKKATLPHFGNKEIKNTNILLYNVPEAVGLKTGTTVKAGSCLVAAAEMTDGLGKTHYLVSIEFGAENAQVQNYSSLALLTYAKQCFKERTSEDVKEEEEPIPVNAEELIRAVIKTARKG